MSELRYDEDFDGYGGDLSDPAQRCKHGTFIGTWSGPDYLCQWCETGEEPPPPAPQCEHIWEAWGPNEGCREFMTEPEAIVQCSNPAMAVIVGREHGPDGATELRVRTCAEHLVEIASPGPYWEFVSMEPMA